MSRPSRWVVTIAEHRVERWDIPATMFTVSAVTEQGAIEDAIGQVQRQAGVPAWKPCRRKSLAFASAKSVNETQN